MSQTDNRAKYIPGETGPYQVSADGPLLAEELAYINRMRNGQGSVTAPHIKALLEGLRGEAPKGEKPYLSGLAISGGGIRSATFALGVLQRLAGARILEKMDYLSTVSGGGYIGSALTWWLCGAHRTGAKTTYDLGNDFPYGTADPMETGRQESPILRYLRENGRYLVPGNGISVFSGAAIITRAVLLNLLVWIPLAGLALLLLIKLSTLPFLSGLTAMVASLTGDLLFTLRDLLDSTGTVPIERMFPPIFLLFLVIAAVLLLIFVISSVNYSLLAWMDRGEGARQRLSLEQRGELEFVGQQNMAAHGPQAAEKEQKGRTVAWLLVGLIGLLDIGVAAMVVFWLSDVVEPLFGAQQIGPDLLGRLWGLWPGALFLAVCVGYAYYRRIRHDEQKIKDMVGLRNLFAGFVVLFALDGLLIIAYTLAGTLTPWPWINFGLLSGFIQFAVGVGFVVLANFWVAMLIRILLQVDGISIHYSGRRVFETFFGYSLPICLALIALGILPIIDAWIGIRYAGLEGALSIAAGVGTALWGHIQSRGKGTGGRRTEIVLTIGSALLVYGILLLGFRLASWFEAGDTALRASLAVWCLVGAMIGWFTNINYVSLHRFYRDRLMEAFLPDFETVSVGISGPARRADELKMAEVWDTGADTPFGPMHLINTNVVLANSQTRKYRARGGDNFILSPVFCGSNATGWQRTDTVLDGDLTLASAMATSGAAANPRAGVGGKGVTRNTFLSLVMTLLNFRLGYWIARPSDRRLVKRRPNHFNPSGRYSIPTVGYTESDSFLELSDGGHFENLGVYELVRRRCGLIIVCDGGHDNEAAYADFVTALQRIEQDFGASISFDMEVGPRGAARSGGEIAEKHRSGPESMIARPADDLYPKGAEYAEKGYFIATIDYGDARGAAPWPDKGVLIYLKTTMIKTLSMKARGYKGANPDFPDETTADQFFDEEQFEAYREVGYRIADQMVDDLGLINLMATRPGLDELLNNGSFRRAGAPPRPPMDAAAE